MKRRVYRIDRAGDLRRLKLREETLDKPAVDEVTVKVEAIGLNFADIFAIKGLYSATPKGSFIPGLEYAGSIVEIGDQVTGYSVGDKVMGVTRFGGYADHINIDHRYIKKLPEGWSFADGAAFPVQVLTAYYGLVFLAHLQKNECVLIHSGAGGVGIWANRIAKKFDAFTIGTVGDGSKLTILDSEGYDLGVVRDRSFILSILNNTGARRPNVVMECIGGRVFMESYTLMKEQGRLVTYGAAHFGNARNKPNMVDTVIKYLNRPKIDPLKMMRHNKSVMGFNLIWLFDQADMMNQLMDEVAKLELQQPRIGQVFKFKEMHEAIRLFQSGKTVGKVIVSSGG